jgi:hypothetical protein
MYHQLEVTPTTIAHAEKRIFGRTFVPFERIVFGLLGPLLVAAYIPLTLVIVAFVYALLVPLL